MWFIMVTYSSTLLENRTLDHPTMFDQARALDTAQKNSELYSVPVGSSVTAAVPEPAKTREDLPASDFPATSAAVDSKCFFCGYSKYPRSKCPALMLYAISVRRKGIMRRFVGHRRYSPVLRRHRYIALL